MICRGSGVYAFTDTRTGGFGDQHVLSSSAFKAFKQDFDPEGKQTDAYLLKQFLNMGAFLKDVYRFVYCIYVLKFDSVFVAQQKRPSAV